MKFGITLHTQKCVQTQKKVFNCTD